MPPQRSRHFAAAIALSITLLASAPPVAGVAAEGARAATPATQVAVPTATTSATALKREVFGFALASSLSDPSLGYPSWKFSLLSTVAFFSLHVSWDGTIVHDSGWTVWNSSALTGLLTAARANGTRVVVTIDLQDFAPGTPNMCAGLINRAVTVKQAVAELVAKGVDGVNVDYEGLNGTCQNGQTSRGMMTSFVAAMRAALGTQRYLSVDTYASSAADPLGFFDIASMSQYVDSFVVMAYDLEYSNYHYAPANCSRFCLGPTAPLTGYHYNDTTTASQYLSVVPGSKIILGVPYYGRKSCVGAAVPGAYPTSSVTADAYVDAAGEATASGVQSYATHRDANDTAGQERWDTWFNTSMKCIRELYFDDSVSLGLKYDLINRSGLRGVGIWTLNYGGGAPELWAALSSHFLACRSVGLTAGPAAGARAGTHVSLVAAAAGCPDAGVLYQFWILRPGAAAWAIVQGYSTTSSFSWSTTGERPGSYHLAVWARDVRSAGVFGNTLGTWDASTSVPYTLSPAPCTAVTAAASPAPPAVSGSAVTITANPAGCPNPLVAFWIQKPGSPAWSQVQAYGANKVFDWSTSGAAAGSYRIAAWVRDGSSAGVEGNTAGRWDASVYVDYALFTPCRAVLISTNPAGVASVGTGVTVTATASGCPSPQYEFWVQAPGSPYRIVQSYSPSATFRWTTSNLPAGTYSVSVWARDASSAGTAGNSGGRWDASVSIPVTLRSSPCTGATLTASPSTSAKAGATITFTAAASGCPNPAYEFWIRSPGNSTWRVAQPYSTARSYVWPTTGAAPGIYAVEVWARDAGSLGTSGNTAGRWDSYALIEYSLQ